MLNTDLAKTLEAAARILNDGGHEWVVFGGAAMALHGFNTGNVDDIDIIVSAETATWLMENLSLDNQAEKGSSRFRSDYLLRPTLGPTAIEIMANFQIQSGGKWRKVRPAKLTSICVGRQTIFVPQAKELAEIFDLCGRAKDLSRSQMLKSR